MGFNTDFQKEIWLKHIEVQERVLQVNSAPIIIEPDSIQIFGKRMHLKVCQTDEIDAKINSIKAFFNISDDDIDYVNNTFILYAEGGTRIRKAFKGRRILSPLCLPISPLRQFISFYFYRPRPSRYNFYKPFTKRYKKNTFLP